MRTETPSESHHAVFANCRDLIGADLYRRNAFRVLGISTDASVQRATKSQKLREWEQKLGMAASGAGAGAGLLPLTPAPDSEALRRATEALQDPVTRFVHTFFWLWPTDDRTGPDGAISALSEAHPAVALRKWLKFAWQAPEAVVVQHNIAVLAHALALDFETSATQHALSPDDEKSRRAYWEIVYRHWRGLVNAPSFWRQVRGLRDSSDDPRLPKDIADRLHDWLPEVILGTTAKLMVSLAARASEFGELHSSFAEVADFFAKPNHSDQVEASRQAKSTVAGANGKKQSVDLSGAGAVLRQHVTLLSAGQWLGDDLDRVVRDELQPTVEQLRELAAQVSKMTPQTPVAERTAVLSALVRRSAMVEALLSADDASRSQVGDKVTEAFLEAAIAHGNQDKKWSYWLPLNDALLALARGARLRERLTKTRETLRDNAKSAEEDKALEQAKGALKANLAVDVAVQPQWRVVPLCTCCLERTEAEQEYSYSWNDQHGRQVRRTLKFPLCKECQQHRREGTICAFLLVAVPTAVACALGCLFGHVDHANGWLVAGGSTIAAVGVMLFLATRLKLRPLDQKHACRGASVSIRRADGAGTIVRFSNPVYAHLFARGNGFRKEEPRPSGGYRGTSALAGGDRWALVAAVLVLGLLGSGFTFGLVGAANRDSAASKTPVPTGARALPQPSTRPVAQPLSSPVRADPAAAAMTALASEIESGRARVRDLEVELQDLDRGLKALRAEIDLSRGEIDAYELNLRLGLITPTIYQEALDRYNRRVDNYNSLLNTYKRSYQNYERELDAVNAKIDEYNRRRGR
jgi:hypothetical protein